MYATGQLTLVMIIGYHNNERGPEVKYHKSCMKNKNRDFGVANYVLDLRNPVHYMENLKTRDMVEMHVCEFAMNIWKPHALTSKANDCAFYCQTIGKCSN
jgi:hypothetical protein